MINAAVIGLGNMGKHHVRAYEQLPDVQLVAVCDSSINSYHALPNASQAAYYSNVSEMLFNESIDLISVCVPTSAHFSVAKACMEKGVSVLVEKPIAQSLEEANSLIECSQTNKVILTVGHIERFNPAILKLKELITNGALGHIHTIHSKRYGPFPKQIQDSNVLVDVAVHDIDIVQFLVDSKLIIKNVITRHIHGEDRADYGHLMLGFESKVTANIYVSWALPFKQRMVEIIGDKGIAIVDCMAQSIDFYKVQIKKENNTIYMPIAEPERINVDKKEPIIEECRAFVNAVLQKKKPFVCPRDATEALALALDVS